LKRNTQSTSGRAVGSASSPAVHGFATLWVDGALPFEGMEPSRMAPEIGRMVSKMFAALARDQKSGGKCRPGGIVVLIRERGNWPARKREGTGENFSA